MHVMNSDLLFVYGTLRRTCTTGAHAKYLRDAVFIGAGKISGKLYQVSYYPALTLEGQNPTWVIGEIYRLDDPQQLLRLDAYEECSHPPQPGQEYHRRRVQVAGDDGVIFTAWTYVYQLPTDHLSLIASGDFLNP